MHGNLRLDGSTLLPHLMPIQSGGTPLILDTSTGAAVGTVACRLLGELKMLIAASKARRMFILLLPLLPLLPLLDVHWFGGDSQKKEVQAYYSEWVSSAQIILFNLITCRNEMWYSPPRRVRRVPAFK